jgi:hypothetical protein
MIYREGMSIGFDEDSQIEIIDQMKDERNKSLCEYRKRKYCNWNLNVSAVKLIVYSLCLGNISMRSYDKLWRTNEGNEMCKLYDNVSILNVHSTGYTEFSVSKYDVILLAAAVFNFFQHVVCQIRPSVNEWYDNINIVNQEFEKHEKCVRSENVLKYVFSLHLAFKNNYSDIVSVVAGILLAPYKGNEEYEKCSQAISSLKNKIKYISESRDTPKTKVLS